MKSKYKTPDKNKHYLDYIRVGTDYFKLIYKPDRFGILRRELKRWSKEEIKLDFYYDKNFLNNIRKYDDFIIHPDNNGVSEEIGECFNMYHKFPHEPKEGSWRWTETLLKHVFGDQYDAGLIYMKVLYEYPRQALPVLVLVSEDRETGKSTFLDWMHMVFGANMVMIEPDVIGGNFNGEYATANIIGIDETIIEKQIAVEKIKSLATKKYISVNIKHVAHFELPFFGKIILASNNEDKFMRVDTKEIRFWVRKLDTPKEANHNILNDMVDEIPAFLYYLKQLPEPDFSKSRMVLTADQISNEYLERVKEESKSWLYHELKDLFTDFFGNYNLDSVEVSPLDIKRRWFSMNNQVTTNYIRKVLRDEFNLLQNNMRRYMAFGEGASLPGRPYEIERKMFIGEHEEENYEAPY